MRFETVPVRPNATRIDTHCLHVTFVVRFVASTVALRQLKVHRAIFPYIRFTKIYSHRTAAFRHPSKQMN